MEDFRLYLQGELIRRCRTNPKYSLRAFARALDVDFSSLSKMLKGQRPIGKRSIYKLGSRLGLDPNTINNFFPSYAMQTMVNEKEIQYQKLTNDIFQIIADWYHYAIMELIAIPDIKQDPRWMARVLDLSVNEVNAALERLERVGMLAKIDDRWIDKTDGFSTNISDHHMTGARIAMQKELLQKALAAVDQVPYEKRDITGMTMAIDATKMDLAREEIKTFRRRLQKLLGGPGEKLTQVYNLSVAFFPLTNICGDDS